MSIKGVLSVFIVYLYSASTVCALQCPEMPKQATTDWQNMVRIAVGRIGVLKGAGFEDSTRVATTDILTRLPEGGRIYLEQMMLAVYCSSLNDNKTMKPEEKTRLIDEYIAAVRKSVSEYNTKATNTGKAENPQAKKDPKTQSVVSEKTRGTQMKDSTKSSTTATIQQSQQNNGNTINVTVNPVISNTNNYTTGSDSAKASVPGVDPKELIDIVKSQQMLYVKKSIGVNAGQCFTDADLQDFISNKKVSLVRQGLKGDSKYIAVVLAIKRMEPIARKDLMETAKNTCKKTWTELGKISEDGQTDAGQTAEKLVASAVTDLTTELLKFEKVELVKMMQ